MDKELEKWYEQQFDLFMQDGWKSLIFQAKEMLADAKDIAKINSEASLWMAKGRKDILEWLIGWEDSVIATHKDLLETLDA